MKFIIIEMRINVEKEYAVTIGRNHANASKRTVLCSYKNRHKKSA